MKRWLRGNEDFPTLEGHLLVLVCHHDIVDVDVRSPHINAVQSTVVTTPDGKVVELAVGAGVQRDVEGGCINEFEIVDGEVTGLDDTEETGTRERPCLMDLIPVPLHDSGSGAGEELDVLAVLDGDHVAACGSCAVDGAVQLKADAGALVQGGPG